ncbi:hypothetical protein ACHAXS_012800 [Conticribra weissflogii]
MASGTAGSPSTEFAT